MRKSLALPGYVAQAPFMSRTTLAIRTGLCYTAVTLDPDENQCRVACDIDGISALVVGGTGEASIKKAATDCSGRGYQTLRGLRSDYPSAVRRRDLDC